MPEMVRKQSATHAMHPKRVHEFMQSLFAADFHAQRVFSMATGVVGVLHAAAASIHAIGLGLAIATGRKSKHAIKQVDRLLSNAGLSVWDLFQPWVTFVLGERDDIVVALDWTEFDADGHSTLALHLVTTHGRSTPLLWRTVYKRALESRRSEHERELLQRFRELVPDATRVTILADRGFGSQSLYTDLQRMKLDFVIRFRSKINVLSATGEARTAADWVPPNGKARMIRDARVTSDETAVAAVVCVKAKNMKDPWCLASSRADLTAAETVKLYSRRFTLERSFRDQKDLRFGLGLSATHIGTSDRRDRLLLLIAVAQALMTLLGAAAEGQGLDRHTKANTSKKRTHSLYRQGWMWYQLLPTARDEWVERLMNRFGELVRQQAVFAELFGIL